MLAASTRCFLREFGALLERVRSEVGEAVPLIFMTGGISRAQYVPACVREVFDQSEVVMGDASLGVVAGPAQFAGEQGRMAVPAKSAERVAEREQKAECLARQREWFQKRLVLADKISDACCKRHENFHQQYTAISGIFKGARVGEYLAVLADQVGETYGFNEEAG